MIGQGVWILWGSKIAISHWQSQSPLTQGWRYRAARDTGEDMNETEQNSFIFLSDANSLYGHSMVQALPTSDFRFLSREEIDSLDITNEPEVGYILEVDLEYPSELHDLQLNN